MFCCSNSLCVLNRIERHLERQVVLQVGADLLVGALGVAGDPLEMLLDLRVVVDLEVIGGVDVPLEVVVVDVVLAEVRHELRLRVNPGARLLYRGLHRQGVRGPAARESTAVCDSTAAPMTSVAAYRADRRPRPTRMRMESPRRNNGISTWVERCDLTVITIGIATHPRQQDPYHGRLAFSLISPRSRPPVSPAVARRRWCVERTARPPAGRVFRTRPAFSANVRAQMIH